MRLAGCGRGARGGVLSVGARLRGFVGLQLRGGRALDLQCGRHLRRRAAAVVHARVPHRGCGATRRRSGRERRWWGPGERRSDANRADEDVETTEARARRGRPRVVDLRRPTQEEDDASCPRQCRLGAWGHGRIPGASGLSEPRVRWPECAGPPRRTTGPLTCDDRPVTLLQHAQMHPRLRANPEPALTDFWLAYVSETYVSPFA